MVGQAGFGGIAAKQSVIDVVSGKRLFDTKANGWKAAGRPTLIMPENKLIVSGQRTAKEKYTQAVGIYDMSTGNEVKLFKLKGTNSLTGRPSIIDGGVILPTFKGVYRIDMNTGSESWVVDLKNVAYVIPDNDGKSMFAVQGKGNNHVIHKISASGAQMCGEVKKLKGVVSNFEVMILIIL